MPKKTSATKSSTGTTKTVVNKPPSIYEQYFAVTKEYTEKTQPHPLKLPTS
jgi:hypothetical protein